MGQGPTTKAADAVSPTASGRPATREESPVLRQYLAAKSEHPDAILLFRLGDFFETFQEDAETAAPVLGITLTSRDFGRAGRHPMAGFPAHAAEGYIGKLLAAGHSVAVCDQVEEAAAAKGLVRREVVRVLTPGTVVEGALLDPGRENPLVAVGQDADSVGLAVVEVSAGRIELIEISRAQSELVPEMLARIAPSEVLLAEDQALGSEPSDGAYHVSRLEPWRFDIARGRRHVLELLGTASLRGFDCEDLGAALGALGAVLDYLRRNHVALPREVVRLRRGRISSGMHLDAPTIATLELVESLGGGGRGLLGMIDRTRTAMGARRLRSWLLSPLLDRAAINRRLQAVEELVTKVEPRERAAGDLRAVRDLERLTTRTAQGRATPRDLGAIRDSLPVLVSLRETLAGASAPALRDTVQAISPQGELHAILTAGLEETLPATELEGGIVRSGFDPQLDELRRSIRDAKTWIAALQQRERDRTGIKGLKVGFNRVFGYYIEVSNANRTTLPENYQRKQTLAAAERYITPELKEREGAVLSGEQAINAREREVFAELCRHVVGRATILLAAADAIGDVDCLLSLALAATEHGWTQPQVNDGYQMHLSEGRHPLVEASLGPGNFVPNDLALTEDGRLILLTGPNMAGKSTYLRQVGLLVLLAQVGSFVPATSAEIGIVDRIFTRVGAQDSITRGLSTFMVEMVETANILHHATRRSLVIIDEIGRGTSTYDGISIAQAVLEALHHAPNLGCKTLFATHFHELTAMADTLPGLRNHRVEVSEQGDRVVFLHRIVPGGADRSFGIHVADIAGLPADVTARARQVLVALEQTRPLSDQVADSGQLILPIDSSHAVVRRLGELDLDRLSPLEALNQLAELQAEARTGGSGTGIE